MDEIENQNVATEVVLPSDENHVAEAQETKETEKPDQQDSENFKNMRRKQNELERRLKEKDEMIEKVLQMQLNQSNQASKVVEEPEEPDEEFIPKGKVKSLAKKQMAPLEKRLEELEGQLAQQKQAAHFDKLKKQYSDFDEVVNPDTLALLEEQDPELAQTIVDLKDPYKIGLQSYKFIKALNLAPKAPDRRHAKEVEKKLEQNAKTVQTPQAFDKRPLAEAYRLTDAEKTNLYNEMMGFARMV